MTYEQAIRVLSNTPYDVALYEGQMIIYKTTAEGTLPYKEQQHKGDWEQAVIKGAEYVMENCYND